jgi:ABC-type sugar transport system substrate-binding protein
MRVRATRRSGRRTPKVGSTLVVAVAALACTGPLAGCGTDDSSGGQAAANTSTTKPVSVTFILPGLTNPFYIPAIKGAKDAAKKYGAKLDVTGTQSSGSLIPFVQTAIASRATGILVSPEDPDSLNTVIKDATGKGITVGTFILDSPNSERKFFMGPDTEGEGKQQAKLVLDRLHAEGFKGTAEASITSCVPGATGQQLRRKGFEEVVTNENAYKADFTVKVVAFLNATVEDSKSHATYVNLLKAHPKLKVMYGMCAPDTKNAGLVAKQNGDKDLLVVGYDWLPQTLDLIEEGWIDWSLGEDPYGSAYKAVESIVKHSRGEGQLLAGVNYSKGILATKDNVAEIRKTPNASGG